MSFRRALLELFFPPRCLSCGEVVERAHALCADCRETLALEQEMLCPVCGKPHTSCVCGSEPFAFTRCISAVAYGPKVAQAIDALKHDPESPISRDFARMMAEAMTTARTDRSFEWITEVPMLPEECIRRGHNQARTLAVHLSRLTGIPYCETPLVRLGQTRVQHTLSSGERRKNAKSSYEIAPDAEIHGRVLLIDDVATTGSTLDRCAALLRSIGAREVVCLTAATTLLREHPRDPLCARGNAAYTGTETESPK